MRQRSDDYAPHALLRAFHALELPTLYKVRKLKLQTQSKFLLLHCSLPRYEHYFFNKRDCSCLG